MRKLPLLLILFMFSSCGISTEKGSYIGVLIDVSFGGLVFSSCELFFKTDTQSSTQQHASIRTSERECKKLEGSVGKKFKVSYKNSINDITIDSKHVAVKLEQQEL